MTVMKISTEINNEIVLLRQCVRRARICVINKLVREVKRLRVNRSNEKLLEKNKNKAEKYLREVCELKRAKDDEISKFGIINLENLARMLQNSQTDDRTRAMIKVVRYKCLNEKIMEFVKKFPNCKECISCHKKEHSSKKNRKTLNSEHDHNHANSKQTTNDEIVNDEYARNIRLNTSGTVDGETPLEKLKQLEQETEENCVESNEKSSESAIKFTKVTKVISNEATVKRFVDVLEESGTLGIDDRHEGNKNPGSSPIPATLTRADEFFLNSNKVITVNANAATFSPAKNSNITSKNADKQAFSNFLKRSEKRDFSMDERSQKNRNQRRQEASNKAVSYGSNAKERNTVFNGQKKQFPRVKETSRHVHENFEKDRTMSMKNEGLHPSWAARRKLQDAMKQGFQGKKIRFSDSEEN